MDKRLFRNEHEKVIAGVSSGIAEYMEVDVTIIRLLFVLSTIFLVGTGILVYLIMWIVVPVNNDPASRFSRFNDFYRGQSTQDPFGKGTASPGTSQSASDRWANSGSNWTSSTINDGGFKASPKPGDFQPIQNKNNETGRMVGGLFLLVIGIYFLMNEFHFIPFWFSLSKLWPLVFVAIGFSFIMKSKQKNAWEDWKREQEQRAYSQNAPSNAPEPAAPPVAETPLSDTPVADAAQEAAPAPKIDDRFTKKDL